MKKPLRLAALICSVAMLAACAGTPVAAPTLSISPSASPTVALATAIPEPAPTPSETAEGPIARDPLMDTATALDHLANPRTGETLFNEPQAFDPPAVLAGFEGDGWSLIGTKGDNQIVALRGPFGSASMFEGHGDTWRFIEYPSNFTLFESGGGTWEGVETDSGTFYDSLSVPPDLDLPDRVTDSPFRSDLWAGYYDATEVASASTLSSTLTLVQVREPSYIDDLTITLWREQFLVSADFGWSAIVSNANDHGLNVAGIGSSSRQYSPFGFPEDCAWQAYPNTISVGHLAGDWIPLDPAPDGTPMFGASSANPLVTDDFVYRDPNDPAPTSLGADGVLLVDELPAVVAFQGDTAEEWVVWHNNDFYLSEGC